MRRLALHFQLTLLLVGSLLVGCDRPSPRDLLHTTSFELAREHGRHVEVEGLNLFAIEVGSGRDVILLHGNPTNAYTWRLIIEPLAERYRVHAIDLPGFGFSDKPAGNDYAPAWLARMVVGYMDAVDAPTAVLVGNSMGGEVATEAAILFPARVAALILVAPSGLPEPDATAVPFGLRLASWPGVSALLPYLPVRSLARDALRTAVYDPELIDEEVVDAYYEPLRSEGGMRAFVAGMTRQPTADRESLLRRIRVPTLVIVGDSDRLLHPDVARRHHELIDGSRLVELAQTGHVPQEERAERVIDEAFRLIDSLP